MVVEQILQNESTGTLVEQAPHKPRGLGGLPKVGSISKGLEMAQYMDAGIDLTEIRGEEEKFESSTIRCIHKDLLFSFSDESSDIQDFDDKAPAEQTQRVVTDESLKHIIMQDDLALLDGVMLNISRLEKEVRALRTSVGEASLDESCEGGPQARSAIDSYIEGRQMADSGRDSAAGVTRPCSEDGASPAAMKKREQELERREALLRQREALILAEEKRAEFKDYCESLHFPADQLALQVIKVGVCIIAQLTPAF